MFNHLHFTHIDLDGIGCYMVGARFGQIYKNTSFINYPDLENRSQIRAARAFKDIIFTDFSPSKYWAYVILKAGRQLMVIDHHQSSAWLKDVAEVVDNLKVNHVIGTSGTRLYYDFLAERYSDNMSPNPAFEDYVELTNTYDMFLEDHPRWEEALNLNRLFWASLNYREEGYGRYAKYMRTQLAKFQFADKFKFTDQELEKIAGVVAREETLFHKAMNELQVRLDEEGHTFGLFSLPSKVSVVAKKILAARPDLEYLIAVNTFRDKYEDLSARARNGEFDVTQLSWIRGHKAAGGGKREFRENVALLHGDIPSIPYGTNSDPVVGWWNPVTHRVVKDEHAFVDDQVIPIHESESKFFMCSESQAPLMEVA